MLSAPSLRSCELIDAGASRSAHRSDPASTKLGPVCVVQVGSVWYLKPP